MAIRTIISDPDDRIVRDKAKRVARIDDSIRRLFDDMIDTMRSADGVGLAAQQVGVALQIAVVDVAEVEDRPSLMWVAGKEVDYRGFMPMVLLNPQLELGREKEPGTEGCLSFPKINADINRAIKVRCIAQTLDGAVLDFEAAGFLARALQHEVDHLNGVLFIDRMSSAAKASVAGKIKRLQKR